MEPIAIVGLGKQRLIIWTNVFQNLTTCTACRLPGEIKSASGLWEFLETERSAQSDIPKNRMNLDAWYHPNGQRPGSINTSGGFFLSQDDSFRQFDPSFFGISPLEATSMDPQQRKLLEVVYESFESAGVRLEDVSGSNTGCFIGNFTWDFGQLEFRDIDFWKPYRMTVCGFFVLTYMFNFESSHELIRVCDVG